MNLKVFAAFRMYRLVARRITMIRRCNHSDFTLPYKPPFDHLRKKDEFEFFPTYWDLSAPELQLANVTTSDQMRLIESKLRRRGLRLGQDCRLNEHERQYFVVSLLQIVNIL